MATRKTTTRKHTATRKGKATTGASSKRAQPTKRARPAARRTPARKARPTGPAENALALVGQRADQARERIGALAERGGRAAAEGFETVRESATQNIERAKKSWDKLDAKSKAGVVAKGIAALAVAVAVPLVRKLEGKR